MREARDSGRYALTRIEGSIHRTPHEGVMMALMTRVRKVDATDAGQLSAAEFEGRRQAHEYFRFLRECVPGYERSVLLSTSPAIGVRESRRIVGEHVLTAEEILAATSFDDQIALCGAPIEEHHAGDDTRWVYLDEGATYGIPYRALQPRGLDNVLVAGRCFSATHDAHASARSMGTCMAMGQAAGTAVALADEPKRLDAGALRARLREDGADVGA
jgi:FAD-dependent oxidoreductase family protein